MFLSTLYRISNMPVLSFVNSVSHSFSPGATHPFPPSSLELYLSTLCVAVTADIFSSWMLPKHGVEAFETTFGVCATHTYRHVYRNNVTAGPSLESLAGP